jgi:hypothetical protein
MTFFYLYIITKLSPVAIFDAAHLRKVERILYVSVKKCQGRKW